MDANGLIFSVGAQPTNNGKQLYKVATQIEGPQGTQAIEMVTFDAALAGQVAAYAGGAQRVSIRYGSQQKGQYTNYYINAVALEGQLPPDTGQNGGRSQQRPGGGAPGSFRSDPEIQKSIVKQSSFGTAFEFIGRLYDGLGPDHLDTATAQAMDLASKLYEIAKPHPAQPTLTPVTPTTTVPVVATQPIVPTATTPAEVAAQVPGVTVGSGQAVSGAAAIAWD